MSGFRRNISVLSAWGLAFGYAVGWGAFVMPGAKFLPDAGPLGTVIGIALGALAMAVIGWNYHRLAQSEEGAGGAYAYATKAFGADYGFLTAWSLSLAYMAILWANATALVLLVRYVFGDALQFGWHSTVAGFDVYFGEAILSVGMIVLSGAFCLVSRKLGGLLVAACAVFMVVAISVCFGAAARGHEGGLAAMAPAFAPNGAGGVTQVLRILAMMPWAFVGFEAVTHSAPEFAFGRRRLWTVLAWSIVASAAAYVMLALLPVLAHPAGYDAWPHYIHDASNLAGLDNMPTFAAVRKTMGGFGVGLLAATMMAAILTGILASIVAMSRLLYTLSSDGVLTKMRWMGRLDKNGTPRNAILFVVAISLGMPFFGRTVIGWPVEISSIGAAVAYCCTSAAAFKVAKGANDTLGKVTGAAGAVMSTIFCLLQLVPNYLSTSVLSAESYLVLALWCILGFLLYRQTFKRDTGQRFGRSPVVWTGIVIMIFFSSLMWVRLSSQKATDETVKAIVENHERHCVQVHGEINEAALDDETSFVTDEMETLGTKQLVYDVLQMLLLSFSLFIMFSLYTIQRRREEKLQVLQAQAEARDRAKSSFLSSISHDIRTPMNAIIGYIELAKRNGTTEEKLREYLAKTDAASHHLLALIDDVLEMSRIESGKVELEPVPINLNEVLGDVELMFSAQMSEKRLTYALDLSGVRHPWVMCDRSRFNRVLLNLVSNAYKFTPSGGSVRMSLEEFDCGKADAAVYELRVKDTGFGMSREFVEHVFDAFERESGTAVSGIEGTGLGMPITKGIVDLMGGTISVESELGRGTEFTIRLELPFAAESRVAEAGKHEKAGAEETEPLDFRAMRILLVEDNEINREIGGALLAQEGFTVDMAANGKIAVEKVARYGTDHYNAILMDVHMPVMNGYAATRSIRAMELPGHPRLPIIALSANAFESDVRDALASGMDAHIAKPIKLSRLLKTLEDLMRRSARPQKIRALAEMGCDVETLMRETYVGNLELYMNMLSKLPQSTMIDRMRLAFDASDVKALFEAAHSLKGLYASLGLTPLHALCGQIVEAARSGSLAGVSEQLARLEKMHAAVVVLADSKD